MNEQPIDSPFSTMPQVSASAIRGKGRGYGWIIGTLAALALLGIGTFFLLRYLNDPFRKLEEFPLNQYFEAYQPLAGLKFRDDLRVDADLGWKEGTGRLMTFTPTNDSRQLVVFIPPSLSHIFFNKGQTYTVELEIKEGGLIYGSSTNQMGRG